MSNYGIFMMLNNIVIPFDFIPISLDAVTIAFFYKVMLSDNNIVWSFFDGVLGSIDSIFMANDLVTHSF